MNFSSLYTTKVSFFVICSIWVLSRVFLFINETPELYWETWEAYKLLDYGFAERQGAIINWHYMTGLVEEPSRYNYVNHPYPILWLMTAIYALGSAWFVTFFISVLGLVATLAAWKVLLHYFDAKTSLTVTLLFILAPSTIIFDLNPNIIALGAIIWPLGILLIITNKISYKSKIIYGFLLTLFAGLTSWYSLTVVPVLLYFSFIEHKEYDIRERLLLPVSLCLGSSLSLGWMGFQVIFYSYDLGAIFSYASAQASRGTDASFLKMLVAICFRAGLSIGPAIPLGIAAGLSAYLMQKNRNLDKTIRQLITGIFAYFAIFIAAGFVLMRFYYREETPYEYLIFPSVLLLAVGFKYLCKFDKKATLISCALITFALIGSLYPQIRAVQPSSDNLTDELSSILRDYTPKRSLVFTDLRDQHRPFPVWDASGYYTLRLKSDRFLWQINLSGIRDVDLQIASSQGVVYFFGLERENLASEISDKFPSAQKINEFEIKTISSASLVSLRLMNLVRAFTGRYQFPINDDDNTTPKTFRFVLYSIK